MHLTVTVGNGTPIVSIVEGGSLSATAKRPKLFVLGFVEVVPSIHSLGKTAFLSCPDTAFLTDHVPTLRE